MHLSGCRPWAWLLLSFCLVWLGLAWLARYHATSTLSAALSQTLTHELLPRMAGVELYSVDSGQTKRYLATRINSDLRRLCQPAPFALLADCSALVLQFKDVTFAHPYPAKRISLNMAADQQLVVGVYYRTRWLLLMVLQALWLLPVMAFLLWFPRPLSAAGRTWAKRLAAKGVGRQQLHAALLGLTHVRPALQNELGQWLETRAITGQQAAELLAHPAFRGLYPEQLQWLRHALQIDNGDMSRAFTVASSAPKLQFFPAERTVVIHGLPIELPATPFFYYYWYALRRCRGDGGWFINPPTHSSDRHHHAELIALCEKYGGHARAVKDLQDKGLRSKTLDQNRSKIKDELCRLLGDTLAKDYLFDTERDAKTARYKYRLSLAAQLIELPRDDLQLLNSTTTIRAERTHPAA